MTRVLTEEQESIRATARKLFQERSPVSCVRRLRDDRDPDGFSRDLWAELASLGLAGIAVPEAHGGAGLGLAELGLVLEEAGRTLAATPLVSTMILGAGAIALAGTADQRGEVLPRACAGERILAFAHEEGTRHAPYRIATRAAVSGGGWRITGEKTFVLDGHVADAFVVVARTSGGVAERDGLTLFLVPAKAGGVEATRTTMVDGRNAARVRFDGVVAGREMVIGEVDRGAEVLDPLLDRARVGLAAEMLGSLAEAFDRTIAYLKVRRQFGVPIGSFQALKHRTALMFCEVELSRSIVGEAARAIDAGRADAATLASTAKARTSDAFMLVANEAIQMHGGVGVTDELDIGFFLKRARAAEMTFGGAAFHRDRFARLSGY